jgi:hypothetical protein
MTPILMIELRDLPPDSTELATQMFADLGLPHSAMVAQPFADGSWRYFLILKTPGRIDDCKIIARDDAAVAVIHGTDCTMVRRIYKDMRYSEQTNFQYCAQCLAGGAFETIDITELPMNT